MAFSVRTKECSMVSNKSVSAALVAISLAAAHCSSGTTTAVEKNFSFSVDRNLIVLGDATIQGGPARVILATAAPRSIQHSGLLKNPGPVGKNPIDVRIGHRFQASLNPDSADLTGIGDLLLGYDAFQGRTVVIDFGRRLISVLRSPPSEVVTSDLYFSSFQDHPAIGIEVNGTRISALIDTANADTLTLPLRLNNGRRSRRTVELKVGEIDLKSVDASFADVSSARIGNRILQQFVVRIDYRHKKVSLWSTSRGNG